MGWCRCTYRNCTMRSDGVTHMFHYPVFDKVRCHQWLTNAQRTDFLDLKLSQLKNRSVCQHHFKDECFMNYKKDKLRMTAVPTENGPYCASKGCSGVEETLDLPVNKLETEQLTHNQKVASFKVKYRDFLINYDTLDLDCQALQLSLEENKADVFEEKPTLFARTPKPKSLPAPEIKLIPKKPEQVDRNSTQNIGTENVNPNDTNSHTYSKPSHKSVQNFNSELSLVNSNNAHPQDENLKSIQNNNFEFNSSNNHVRKESSVKILKVENVSFPNNYFAGKVFGQEQFPYDVCIINNPIPQPRINLSNADIVNIPSSEQNSNQIEPRVNSENIPDVQTPIIQNNSLLKSQNNSFIQSPDQSAVKTTVLGKSIKVKLSPEEYAKIEEKRRLNRTKVKEMVLEQLESQSRKPQSINEARKPTLRSCKTQVAKQGDANTPNKSLVDNQLATKVKQVKALEAEKVSQYLAKEPELPSVDEYNMASLTNKLQRMEELLLNKIDQNARRINELKSIVEPKPEVRKKQSTFTQTNMEDYKRYLFEEISVFLKTETKSQIYEELFINKHSIVKSRRSPPKSPQTTKRRRR